MSQSYQVEYLPLTEKFFKKHPANLCSQILEKVDLVARDPFAPNSNLTQLKDPISGFRLRIGDFRIIYVLDKENRRLVVVKIDHRSSVYKP
ncbi:MAG: Addiction module toxin, RelE/StbE family [Candidatus Amesbacteria bacterium GW2011_GWB1_47_26]|uniref:Addiction module toxin, RelE/StbE family n=1 Tax=Candidatus Amesbacteria bacterium GW2011_GWC2_45_19 TaxID=1618366 RepID=A0A0G1PBB4_9BACT|nr:MAG: Addiction module toxin, RelE/StbE family [Candidatus Amesbacteria bacterium GW2011_GWC2_45_19]KKU37740.1 MAG: Addiction module toxin, RelE/StbE family [Candidatus Amesbacteria bacterium GW2011_GWA1_46_35]KKU69372.1 MAG: Addiction module toxin, RelE/StbE family [Microgenomates group bacterium GW2011_GWC1_47_20]KKU74524.1 MAG: Addiction module toxin, RelE/StbE family [Candidatus Amesbacteria bacterium GW2011_GWB1_47_26]KKU78664.1 MAG: Addiction module toxin, RelE/StbE family [Candidatus A